MAHPPLFDWSTPFEDYTAPWRISRPTAAVELARSFGPEFEDAYSTREYGGERERLYIGLRDNTVSSAHRERCRALAERFRAAGYTVEPCEVDHGFLVIDSVDEGRA